ncbi:hypothetical protein EBT31_02890 [bacterium]|nr:hypothetical protein [bacterium]
METMTVTQFIAGQVEALLYDKLHELLGVIAQDYDLSHGELVEKYLKYKNEVENPKVIYKATEVVEPEKPKRAPRKAKVTQKAEEAEEAEVDDRKGKCEATTAKGLPCKNKAFGGGCFCRVHTKKDEEESKPAKKQAAKKTRGKALEEEAKPEPKKRGRKPKKAQPEHSHPLDEEAEDCKLCDTHGNPLGEEQEFEIDEAQLKREALREIMKEELGVEEVTDEMLAEIEQNMENDADPLEAKPDEEDEMGELVDKAMAELSDDEEREEGEVIEEDLD